jgi:hypothetical protein
VSLFRESLITLRAPLVDDGRGGLKRDWGTYVPHVIPGWSLDAGITFGDRDNRAGAKIAYTARGPIDADVEETDRIVYAGKTYVIEGGVERQMGVTARTSHCIILLARWKG